jgi:hypothetical protein
MAVTAVTALPVSALSLGCGPVLDLCSRLHETWHLCTLQCLIERVSEFREALDSERQSTRTRLKGAVRIPPPSANIDRKAVVESIIRKIDSRYYVCVQKATCTRGQTVDNCDDSNLCLQTQYVAKYRARARAHHRPLSV